MDGVCFVPEFEAIPGKRSHLTQDKHVERDRDGETRTLYLFRV